MNPQQPRRSTVFRFIGLDCRSLRPYLKSLIIPMVIVLAVVVPGSKNPYGLIPGILAFGVLIFTQYLFVNDERGRLDTLYCTLGIERKNVVAGRYASGIALLASLAAVGLLLAPLVALALGVPFDWALALGLTVASIGGVGLLVAIEFPLFFALGATKARMVGIVIPAVVVGLIALVGMLFVGFPLGALRWLGQVDLVWFGSLAIIVAVVLGAVSERLSVHLYARRDL